MDKVKNFCDHSMILWEMAGDLLTSGSFWPPPASLRVKCNKTATKYFGSLCFWTVALLEHCKFGIWQFWNVEHLNHGCCPFRMLQFWKTANSEVLDSCWTSGLKELFYQSLGGWDENHTTTSTCKKRYTCPCLLESLVNTLNQRFLGVFWPVYCKKQARETVLFQCSPRKANSNLELSI